MDKFDLIWAADFRNTSITLHSDVVLPVAIWYEKHDISSTDMHPFVHPFNTVIDPPWEARTGFQVFQALAELISAWAPCCLGTQADVVTTPLTHDTPDTLMMAHGDVFSLPQEWVPGVTMSKLMPTERDYAQIRAKFDALGPLTEKLRILYKGIILESGPEMKRLARNHGVPLDGIAAGQPLLDTDIRATDTTSTLSGITSGRVTTESWDTLPRCTGTPLVGFSEEEVGKHVSFADTQVKPQRAITSPEWSGSEYGGRRYSAFMVSVEHVKP